VQSQPILPDVVARPPSQDERAGLRDSAVAAIPRWYCPALHLLFPSAVGLSIIGFAVHALRDLHLWQLCAVPVTFVLSNITEWRGHKYILHRRTRYAATLYERHTPLHHRIYVTSDMAMRSRREFRLVLIPAYGILLIALQLLPLLGLLLLLGQANMALLMLATSMGYVLSYEWLHLSYHLPPQSFIGRRALVRVLRHHHAIHHDPALMQRWNMNVTFPLWDWVKGTIYTPERAAAYQERRRARP
jgi:hypothetical protein